MNSKIDITLWINYHNDLYIINSVKEHALLYFRRICKVWSAILISFCKNIKHTFTSLMCQYISAAFYFLSAEFYNHWLNKPTEFETFRKHMHSMWVQIYILYLLLHIKSTWFCWKYWYLVNYLRNQSHIFFGWSRYQPKKDGKLHQYA